MVRGIPSFVRKLFVIGIILAVSLTAFSINSFANTINVIAGEVDIDANGDCSLREAIENANDDGGPTSHVDCAAGADGLDTIILQALALPQSPAFEFTDAPGAFDLNGSNALPPIFSDIVIEGNGQTLERTNGGCGLDGTNDAGDFRFFLVSGIGNLTLKDLTIENGCADGASSEDGGGAIFVDSEIVASAGFFGSGLPFSFGILTLENTTIKNSNADDRGGAIFFEGGTSGTITGSLFEGNFAGSTGGAIFFADLTEATITDTDFIDNRADGEGGAIAAFSFSELAITRGSFRENSADDDDDCCGDGGAIFFIGNLEITDVTFDDNSAENGGAIASIGSVAIQGSTFSNNDAESAGGAVISSGIFVVGSAGGPLLFSALFNQDDNLIVNSTFVGNEADEGGAIINTGQMKIISSTIAGNGANDYFGGSFGFCFGPETLVMMADGSTMRIADIAVGDRVMSYDFGLDQQVPNSVIHTFNREAVRYLNINGLRVTDSHPFAVGSDEWVTAGDLQLGDRVVSPDGWTEITRIEEVFKPLDVYTLSVENAHNFYVSDGEDFYLVHNKMPLPGGGGIANDFLATLTISNTVLAFNLDQFGEPNNCITPSTGDIVSGGFNIDNDGSCGFNNTGDLVTDPLFGNFEDNGGPTETVSLADGSPALDAIPLDKCVDQDGNSLTADQRGVDRPKPSARGCDIGAFERDSAQLIVEINGVGAGNVTSNPPGIDCPAVTCQFNFPLDTDITLTATPTGISKFGGSNGDTGCDTLDPTLDQSKKCHVSFVPNLNVLGAPEQVSAVASFDVPFWCGETKELYTQDGSTFAIIQQYDVEIELILPQKRILLIIPVGGDPADFVESATLTEPSNFLTPGVMSLPMRSELDRGKTLKLSCDHILSLPTNIDPNTNKIDAYIASALGEVTKFGGILNIGSSSRDMKVFITKIVRRLEGTLQSNGEIDLLRSDIDRERKEINPVSVSVKHNVSIDTDIPLPPFAPMPIVGSVNSAAVVQARSISNSRAIDFRVEGMNASDLSVEVFALNGAKVFDQKSSSGPLRWNLRDLQGRFVANGVYLYRVIARGPDGHVINSGVKKFLVLR